MDFEGWLADLLGEIPDHVAHLLDDKTALHFLMAWSLFESKCFEGYLKSSDLEPFAKRMVVESFKSEVISEAAKHFHARYQDKSLLKSLMQREKNLASKMNTVLGLAVDKLQPEDKVFLIALVVTRFRNNIFHGTKKIPSWPSYKVQIVHCTRAMQSFVTHSESLKPTLKAVPSNRNSAGAI